MPSVPKIIYLTTFFKREFRSITMYLFLIPTLVSLAVCTTTASPEAGILTEILNSNGTNISPGFQTLVFEQPTQLAVSNLTDRQMPWTREISSCRHQDAIFQYSFCRRHQRSAADLRAYTIVCKAPPPGPDARSPRYIIEHDFCTSNELCLDGPTRKNVTRGRHPQPTKAYCVGKSGFIPVTDFLDFQQKFGFRLWKNPKTTDIRFTFPDQSTPLIAEKIEVDLSQNRTDSQDSSCQDCSSLTTTMGDEKTDLLRTQATIQGAAAGVLWLAFMSGAIG